MARALERIKRLILIERFLPALTVVGAITAFSLSLVALLATAKNGLQQFDVVMLNTTTVFQNLARIENAPSITARASRPLGTAFSEIARVRYFRGRLKYPQLPSPTAGTPAAKQGNDLASSLQDLANVLVGTKSGAAGEQLLQVIDRIMSVIVDSLEMKEWYGIYMRKLCAGNYVLNASRGETTMQATGCVSFGDVNMQPSLSTVQIGTTRVDFSTVNFQTKSPQHRDY